MKTEQEVFDFVVTSVIEQGQPSYDGINGCLYRGPDGTKCAVGFLIPDWAYAKWMDDNGDSQGLGNVVERIRKSERMRKAGWFRLIDEHFDLLEALQGAHDHAADDGNFLRSFKAFCHDVASAYDLSTEVLQ